MLRWVLVVAAAGIALAATASALPTSVEPEESGEGVGATGGAVHDEVPAGNGTLPAGNGTLPAGNGTLPAGNGTLPAGNGTLPAVGVPDPDAVIEVVWRMTNIPGTPKSSDSRNVREEHTDPPVEDAPEPEGPDGDAVEAVSVDRPNTTSPSAGHDAATLAREEVGAEPVPAPPGPAHAPPAPSRSLPPPTTQRPPAPALEPMREAEEEAWSLLPVAAGTSLLALAGAAAVQGRLLESAAAALRRLVWGGVGLFAHIDRKEALEHPARSRLFDMVRGNPGLRVKDLCAKVELSRTAVGYHMEVLERRRFVKSHMVGRCRHYYPAGSELETGQHAILLRARHRRIAECLVDRPGSIQKQICETVGLRPNRAHESLGRLVEAGLVRSEPHGRAVRYYPTVLLRGLLFQPCPAIQGPA